MLDGRLDVGAERAAPDEACERRRQVVSWLRPDLGRWAGLAPDDSVFERAQVRRRLEPELVAEQLTVALVGTEGLRSSA